MENMDHIVKLKEIAKDYDILFVEDSIALQQQVNKFLKKLFKNVYIASDGQEGLDLYKKYNPTIVLTDLTMPKMSGHEMIREIKKIDPDEEIVILSAHSDSDTLMKSFHIGVTDFIAKPVNASKMITTFLKVLSNIKRKELKYSCDNEVKESSGSEDILKIHIANQIKLEVINYYKKVPIINEATVLKVEEDRITIKTSYAQLVAIKNEKKTILDSSFIRENIDCELVEIDFDRYEALLKKKDMFFPEAKNKNELVVEPTNSTKAYIKNQKKEIVATIKSISYKELVLNIKKDDNIYEKHQNVQVKIVFLHDDENSKPIDSIDAAGSIFKIDESINKGIDLTILLKENENIKKFTFTRESQIIDEFKEKFLG